MQPYDTSFWADQGNLGRRAAAHVVPVVLRYVQPRSVVDLGCGIGEWLQAFRQHGVEDYLGVDAPYIDPSLLVIPGDNFLPHDLTTPLQLDREFDLVISLETAEHLAPEAAETFVESLARLGPVILFSAALPHQGGVHHVNEQWPDYWREKFARRGFVIVDCIRRHIWSTEEVAFWYAQNTFFYARQDALDRYPALRQAREQTSETQLAVIHPHQYLMWVERAQAAEESLAKAKRR